MIVERAFKVKIMTIWWTFLGDNHMDEDWRKGECTVERGVSFVEMLTNIEEYQTTVTTYHCI